MCGPPSTPTEAGGTQGSCQLLEVGVGRQESSLLGERGPGPYGEPAQVMAENCQGWA